MKAFAFDKNNDVIISDRQIQMVEGDEQLSQEYQITLSTNKGEWFLNEEEGVNMESLHGKHVNKDEARQDIIEASVDLSEEITIEEINFNQNTSTRRSDITIRARKSSDDESIISEVSI